MTGASPDADTLQSHHPDRAWITRAMWVVVALGALLRARQLIFARPLWIDEAMLANNILARSYATLLLPLHSDQTAPVPFLWIIKLVAALAGTSEAALRAVPFVASLVVLIVARRVAAQLHRAGLLSAPASVLLLLLVALSPMLIRYGNELKPYGVDVMWAMLCLLVALHIMRVGRSGDTAPRHDAQTPWLPVLLAGTVVSVSMSPAPFVLAGFGAALSLTPAVRNETRARTWLPASAICWGACFMITYWLVYRPTGTSAYMQRYWVPQFLSPGLPDFGGKVMRTIPDVLRSWFLADGGAWRDSAALLLVVPIGVGALFLWRRQRALLTLIALPLLLAVLASSVKQYPVSPRLVLFGLPGVVVLLVIGLDVAAQRVSRRWHTALVIGAASALLILPARDALFLLLTPRETESIREPIRAFLREHAPDATVYVLARAVPAWLFYTTDWKAPDLERVERLSAITSSSGVVFRHAPSRGAAVRGEGDSLAFRHRDWREVIGVPTGTGPNDAGVNSTQPDEGWADNEARRLVAAGGSELWTVFSSTGSDWPLLVDRALGQRGVTRLRFEMRAQAAVGRYRVPVRTAVQ